MNKFNWAFTIRKLIMHIQLFAINVNWIYPLKQVLILKLTFVFYYIKELPIIT